MPEMPQDRRQEMPQGRRVHDQAKRDKPKHWIGVAISRHPVGAALIVAVAIAMIPLVMVLDQQGTIKRQADTINDQQRQLSSLVVRTQKGRAAASREFCDAINGNATANNQQTAVLQGIILNSVRASRPFEKVYRSFGLPPYKVRLRQATRLAHKLERTKIDPLPCDQFVQRIEDQLKPRPVPNIPPNKK